MKSIFTYCFLLFYVLVNAQNEAYYNLENQKYYLSSIKDNIESMRVYSDSATIWHYLDQMNTITNQIDVELNKIVVEEPQAMEDETATSEDVEVDSREETLENYPWEAEKKGDIYDDEDDSGKMSKFIPFRNKIKTDLVIQFGINSLQDGNATAVANAPEINTGGSWFWDFGISRKVRLGGKTSKVATYYGLSYLINRFKLDNDVKLVASDNGSSWSAENILSNRINIGYLNIPLGFVVKLGKKTDFLLGAYGGYRVYTAQNIHLKNGTENVYEKRKDRYGLNNWMYGAQVGLDIKGFDINFKYNFSKLFNDNSAGEYNIWMVGTSIRI